MPNFIAIGFEMTEPWAFSNPDPKVVRYEKSGARRCFGF